MSDVDWEGLAKSRGLELLAAKSQIADLADEVAGITRANDANVATHNAIVRGYMARIAELEAEVAALRPRPATIGALMGADAYYDPKQQRPATIGELMGAGVRSQEAQATMKASLQQGRTNVSRETPTHAPIAGLRSEKVEIGPGWMATKVWDEADPPTHAVPIPARALRP